jgi:outer membrane lipoprotein
MLGGCASNIPLEIREDITDKNISIKAASQNFDQNMGEPVRWGGTIANVENNATDTWIEIVGRKLGSYGQPLEVDQTQGRFIARVDDFLDPAVYKLDRRITIYGKVESRVVRQIDDHPYTYPLINVQSHYLWSEYDHRRYYGYPYYPYYPYYHPYWYRYHFGYRHGFYPRYRFGLHHGYYW